MISFREIGYWGRLGNQMFQFASTVGIARKVGVDANFPVENCFFGQNTGPFDPNTRSNMTVKCDLLECFDVPVEFFIPLRFIRVDRTYREADFKFDQQAFDVSDFTAIQGYLQTEKYFEHCSSEIRQIFTFKKEIALKANEFMNGIKEKSEKKIVGVHVRRGDYVHSPDHHPPCSAQYYELAFSKFRGVGDFSFLIFSDDPKWCKESFTSPDVIVSDLSDPYAELCSMSQCDHNIIANSSFSWWAAWLNNRSGQSVIAPARWFGPLLTKDVSDLYCKNWIKI